MSDLGPTAPPPYRQPQPPKKHSARNTIAAVLAVIAGIIVLSAALSGAKTTTTPAAVVTATAPAGAAATSYNATPAPTTPAAHVVVLAHSGNGQWSSPPITVSSEWTLAYTFNCSNSMGTGNFIVYEDYPRGAILVNALSAKGADTTYQTGDEGTHTLMVSSECDWTITATSVG